LNPELLHFLPKLHTAPWQQPVPILPNFTLQKLEADLTSYKLLENNYNLVYFDAFAPEKQPKLWTDDIFVKIYQSLLPGGILVSYCAKGSFKRSLKAAGFMVEALPGPGGQT
jgi:tRNA U34 5-methylaminomethyl-2-thiouridine-forming methyltransferase MnmC